MTPSSFKYFLWMVSNYTVWRSVYKMSASYGHISPDCVTSATIRSNQYITIHMPSNEKVTSVWSGFLTPPSKNIHKSNWYLSAMRIKRMKTQHDSYLTRWKKPLEQHTRKLTLEWTVWHSNVLTSKSKSYLLTIQKKNTPVRTSNQTMACLQIKNIPALYKMIQLQLELFKPFLTLALHQTPKKSFLQYYFIFP
jgi:hypothetical protein